MNYSKFDSGIALAIICSLWLVTATRLCAEGISATPEGTPIDLSAQKLSTFAELVPPRGGESTTASIRVSANADQEPTLHLFDIEAPVIESAGYAIVGEVRYEGVTEDGFLEMWNHLPAVKGGREIAASFFSRTLEVSGPMGKLAGNSDWRAFQLPAFVNDGSGRRPLKLTLNVVLPRGGEVELRGLKLQALEMPKLGSDSSGYGRVAQIGVAAALGAVIVLLIWFLKNRKAENELRRIQALDS
jgi:hypothetical protein